MKFSLQSWAIGIVVFAVVIYSIPSLLDILIKSNPAPETAQVQAALPTVTQTTAPSQDSAMNVLSADGIKKTLNKIDDKLQQVQQQAAAHAAILDAAMSEDGVVKVDAAGGETKSIHEVMKEGHLIDKIKAMSQVPEEHAN